MLVRQCFKKGFGSVEVTKTVIYYDVPICINIGDNTSKTLKDTLNTLGSDQKDLIKPEIDVQGFIELAKNMYPEDKELTGDEFYASMIPKGIVSGLIVAQETENGEQVFNGDGTVTVAEVLDGINAIENGSNSDKSRRESIDHISNVMDYFNEGYNKCCWGYSSPFFNLYTRSELVSPVTRLEFAYIIVCCSGIYDSLFNLTNGMGITFNWLKPFDYIKNFKDWNDYNVSLMQGYTRDKPEFNIHKYKGSRDMSTFIKDIKSGKSPIPLPMIMSLIELGVQKMFYFENDSLLPLRQLSRGELCYFLSNVADNVVKEGTAV